ncbi:PRAME family member 8-like [Dama dama]|uniref:PRAME family member 8-like n=1 Tax=Dama dama TaxID=30532 RepID=UPI002A36DD3B|nr:PRAME family member 8-like [Dama dama]
MNLRDTLESNQDSNQRRLRMSVHNPPRLVILAAIGLLRDEPSAISALECLPRELYPPVFMAAVFGRRRETLKAMVPAWPFARLPLGGLMQKPHQRTLQAVLDGLDVLLAQKVHPRRCKLRVLDLRNTGQDFWNMWSGGKDHMPSSSLLAPVAEDMSRIRHALTPLEVYIELCLEKKPLEKFLTYLFRWVEQRKASIHLCCKKMKIISMSKENMKEVLRMVKLDCVQKVKLSFTQKLSTLAQFAPLLGQMSNVQSLIFSRIRGSAVEEQDHQDLLQLTSQILRLRDLRDLRMEAPSFLEGRLDQMLRCLKTPLDNISITNCLLTESDLTHLSWCPKLCQLKGLNLSGVTLTDFSPELLLVLLEKVAGTLEELDLNLCGITDIHLMAFLPALSRCSQLRSLSMCGNLISMAILESLLRHTDRLPDLSLELYPAPQESYSSLGVLHLERLAQIKAELRVILTDLERPRKIWTALFRLRWVFPAAGFLELRCTRLPLLAVPGPPLRCVSRSGAQAPAHRLNSCHPWVQQLPLTGLVTLRRETYSWARVELASPAL